MKGNILDQFYRYMTLIRTLKTLISEQIISLLAYFKNLKVRTIQKTQHMLGFLVNTNN